MIKKVLLAILLLVVIILGSTAYYFRSPLNLFLNAYRHKNDLPPHLNFLVLGLDPRDDILEKTSTTDTIMLVSFQSGKDTVKTVSLPRDLWDYQFHRKINNLYPYFKDDQKDPHYLSSINRELSNITGQKIDYDIVITTSSLRDLLNIVGGLDLYLPTGFRDDEFPNPAYIASPSANIPKYKTVEFKTGWVHLDASNVTDFVRSRHASDSPDTGGTDIGRIRRQQLVIAALIDKLKSSKNVSVFKKLYQFWKTEITTNISDETLLSLALNNYRSIRQISFQKYELPIKDEKSPGVIYYPGVYTERQWAFIPTEKDYSSLKAYLAQVLQ
ncbi:LCP family protein [Patescibacteria group bacterium]|nr:LCP family protein [Patescibacteria group bacterium]